MLSSRSLRSVLKRRRSPRVFLHIGAMKTGTTFIQGLLEANQERLADAGFLFPGERWVEQVRATQQIMGTPEDAPMWEKLSGQMLADPSVTSIFSMEFLSFADHEQATRVLASLEGAEVHLILTIRDTAATMPAQWQTSCRNRATVPWPRFVRGVRKALNTEGRPSGKGARIFERGQGVPRMLSVWTAHVDPSRIHVVTVPPRGSDPMLLWKRFAGVVGVDPALALDPPGDANPSLGHASTELLRLVNAELRDVPRRDYERVIRARLASKVLSARAHEEQPIRLHVAGHRLAARWNQRVREAVRASGARLVGDLEELPVGPPPSSAPKKMSRVRPAEVVAAAVTARDGMLAYRDTLHETLGRPAVSWEPTEASRWDEEEEPTQAAAREVASLARECMELWRDMGDRSGPEWDETG